MQSPSEHQAPETEELNDDDLEFKPIVKYSAIGLAVVALLGVEYATYRLGFSKGFNDGVTSEVVSEAVNTAAVNNLTPFMQAPPTLCPQLQQSHSTLSPCSSSAPHVGTTFSELTLSLLWPQSLSSCCSLF